MALYMKSADVLFVLTLNSTLVKSEANKMSFGTFVCCSRRARVQVMLEQSIPTRFPENRESPNATLTVKRRQNLLSQSERHCPLLKIPSSP